MNFYVDEFKVIHFIFMRLFRIVWYAGVKYPDSMRLHGLAGFDRRAGYSEEGCKTCNAAAWLRCRVSARYHCQTFPWYGV